MHSHRCQPSRNRTGNPAFCLPSRIFAKTSRMFCFISEKINFTRNRYYFHLHTDIVWTKAVRRARAMFSTPSDQIVYGNPIVKTQFFAKKASIFVCECASIDVREYAKNIQNLGKVGWPARVFTSMSLLPAMHASGAGRHGWAPTNSANLYGVCARVRVARVAHACVCVRA